MVLARISGVICSAVIIAGLALGEVRAADGDAASNAADFVSLLTFVGGTPLTQAERERVVAETRAQLRSDPAGVADDRAKTRKFLASLPGAAAWERASKRENLRYRFELLPASDPLRQIVVRHDPTVVYDAAHERLITEATLAAWERACVWTSKFLSVPPPASNFIAVQRAEVKANYVALPAPRQEAIAHIERDFPVGVLLLERADAQKREAIVREGRSEALDRHELAGFVAEAMSDAYDVALQREIIDSSILLDVGFNYNGLYHAGMTHI